MGPSDPVHGPTPRLRAHILILGTFDREKFHELGWNSEMFSFWRLKNHFSFSFACWHDGQLQTIIIFSKQFHEKKIIWNNFDTNVTSNCEKTPPIQKILKNDDKQLHTKKFFSLHFCLVYWRVKMWYIKIKKLHI